MTILEKYNNLKKAIPEHVTLISVSKTRTIDEIKEAYDAGAREFGENKVQELVNKFEHFNSDCKWHLIGHLQRNKVKYIVGKVHLIHSLDSIKLLEEIEKQYSKHEYIANVLIQINIGKEESKTGILVEEINELIESCEKCEHVKVKGLMATIPIGDENSCRYYFKEMKNIFEELKNKSFKNVSMEVLSMGMSGDYKIAIEEGANMVRIGSGVFGARNYSNL